MISGDSVELTEKQVSSGDEVRAAAAPEGNSLPFVAPFNKVSPWVYLALTCLTVTFTSFMAVPLFAVVWPGFFLMYGCALDRLTWKFPAGGLLATFFFTLGGATYFKDERSFGASYFATFGFAIVIMLTTYSLSTLVQVFVWRRCPNVAFSPLAYPTALTGLWQLWFRFGPT